MTSVEIMQHFAQSKMGQYILIRDGELVSVVQKVRDIDIGRLEAVIWVNGETHLFTLTYHDPDNDAPHIVNG